MASSSFNSMQLLIVGAGASALLRLVNLIVGLLISIVLARALAPDGYGVYTFVLSLVLTLCIPVSVGVPTLIVREVARFRKNESWRLIKGILIRAHQVILFLSVLVVVLGFVALGQGDVGVNHSKSNTILIALFLVPIIGLSQLRQSTLQGLGRVIVGQIPENVVRPVVFLIIVVMVSIKSILTPQRAISLYFVASVLAFAVGTIILMKCFPSQAKGVSPDYDSGKWLRSLIPLSALGGLQVINNQADVLMLGIFATEADIAFYRVAVAGGTLVIFVLTAVNVVIAPIIARHEKATEMAQLQDMLTAGARISLLGAAVVAGILVFFGGYAISNIYGSDYYAAYPVLVVLCIGFVFSAAMGSVALVLNMTGNESENLKGLLIATLINVVLNALLIPEFGATGAATASVASLVSVNFILCWNRCDKIKRYCPLRGKD